MSDKENTLIYKQTIRYKHILEHLKTVCQGYNRDAKVYPNSVNVSKIETITL